MSTTSDQRSRHLISSRTPDLTISGSDRPPDAGMLRTAEIVPGKTRKDRSKIMVTPFTRLLVAVTSLATVYSVVAACGNAWANDVTAVAHTRAEMAELVQWHSGLTVISDSCVNPEWKSRKTRRQAKRGVRSCSLHPTSTPPWLEPRRSFLSPPMSTN